MEIVSFGLISVSSIQAQTAKEQSKVSLSATIGQSHPFSSLHLLSEGSKTKFSAVQLYRY